MPSNSLPNKIAATKSYGANVIFSGPTSQEREAVVADVQAQTGAVLIPPYDYGDTILGQGTVALEFLHQVEDLLLESSESESESESESKSKSKDEDNERDPERPQHQKLDILISPLGGGGLLSGLALAAEGTSIKVIGAEPSLEGANDGEQGFESGQRVESVHSTTVADGLRTPLGLLNWDIMYRRGLVEAVYSVTEAQILTAMRLCWERLKVVAEPSACTALAVVLFNERFRDEMEKTGRGREVNVGIVLTGGNVDLDSLAELLERGKEEI
jgi:threonine dehydratase